MRKAQPLEARNLPELPDDAETRELFTMLLVAVNGFPYAGERAEAIALTLRWLRAHPLAADSLLGREKLIPVKYTKDDHQLEAHLDGLPCGYSDCRFCNDPEVFAYQNGCAP